MATVYILHSQSIDRFYVGSCLDLDSRLDQHLNNTFINSFTKTASDWEVFFLIKKLNYQEARNIEKHIKKMKSKAYIQNLKKYSKISEKLINEYM